jgi:dTDP-6-deoxy-L-talose 4-dehydrogenase (NAD+)
MKILVTGATGFIGNHIIPILIQLGVKVVATARNEEKAKQFSWYKYVEFVPFDIGTSVGINLVNLFNNPDQCIHLSWSGLSDFRDSRHEIKYYKDNLLFLTNLIENGIHKITVTGTCLEYGLLEGELKESMAVKPVLPYAKGKNKLREALELLRQKQAFELDWIRLFYMYGEGQSSTSIIPLLESHIINKKASFNMSKGEQKRDYLPVEEVAEKIVSLAIVKNGNGIVNCCHGISVKIIDLIQKHIYKKNSLIRLNLGYYPYPDYEPFEFWGSNIKLKRILNEISINRKT